MLDKPDRDRICARFHDGAGIYALNLPDCLNLPITRFKKLFTVILKEHYLNSDFEEVIAPTIEGWLAYLIEQEKARCKFDLWVDGVPAAFQRGDDRADGDHALEPGVCKSSFKRPRSGRSIFHLPPREKPEPDGGVEE